MLFLSAGHRYGRPGARYNGFVEHTEATLWQETIFQYLPTTAKAILVPSGRLSEKVQFINDVARSSIGPHLAVEIHFNDAVDHTGAHIGRGSETLHYPKSEKGKEFATRIQDSLSLVFGPDRGAKPGWYRMDPAQGPDYFLAKTNCISLIIEPEFVINHAKIIEGREPGCLVIAQTLTKIVGDVQ